MAANTAVGVTETAKTMMTASVAADASAGTQKQMMRRAKNPSPLKKSFSELEIGAKETTTKVLTASHEADPSTDTEKMIRADKKKVAPEPMELDEESNDDIADIGEHIRQTRGDEAISTYGRRRCATDHQQCWCMHRRRTAASLLQQSETQDKENLEDTTESQYGHRRRRRMCKDTGRNKEQGEAMACEVENECMKEEA